MLIPDNIVEPSISLKDQYFDLPGLSAYCSLRISTLRAYIASGGLPCFKLKGKVLIRRSEFDAWLERYRFNREQSISEIADEVLNSLKS